MQKDLYDILGVARDASADDIKKAYHRLVVRYHPDKNPGDKEAEEKFKEINNAFDILKDPQKKAAYDRFGASAFSGGNGASAGGGNPFGDGFEFNFGGGNGGFSDVMDEMLKQFGFGAAPGHAGRGGTSEMRGRDLLHEIKISLRDAFFGKTEEIKFGVNVKCEKCNGQGTKDGKPAPVCNTCGGRGTVRSHRGIFAMEVECPECHGLGRKISDPCRECDGSGIKHRQRVLEVKIPAGVEDGTRLRMAGQGEAAPLGGASGDFYVDISILPDKVFNRSGNDLLIDLNVPFTTLALGGEMDVTTIDDKRISLKIPSGTQIGDRLRMRGLGMPVAGRSSRGDMYVNVKTIIPKNLSSKQKKALEDFVGK